MIRERKFLIPLVFVSLVAASTSADAQLRPIDPSWHDFTFEKAGGEVILSSTFGSKQFSLKFKGESLQREYIDPPRFSIDKKEIQLETGVIVPTLRNKPAREILSAYREYTARDLKARGWNILPAENETFTSNSGDVYLFWGLVAPAARDARIWLHYAATLNGPNIIVLVGLAESDSEKAILKSYVKTAILTIARRSAGAETAEDIARLRAMRRRLDFSSVRLLHNSEIVSAKDADWCRKEANPPCLLLPAASLIEATAMALSPKNPPPEIGDRSSYLTFVSDGLISHVMTLEHYDPDTKEFSFFDTADPSPLANMAGVAAVRGKPGDLWTITKDELEQIIYGIELTPGDIMNAARYIGIGPFGRWGTTVPEALKADFFTYFRLKQTSKAVSGPNTGFVVTFKPEDMRIASLVTVKLYVNDKGRITDADLVLKRKFIDNPEFEMTAGDYAQAFLLGATTPADEERNPELRDEIIYFSDKGLVASGVNSSIPRYPTFGFLTFKGRQQYFMQILSTSRLWLENIIDEGEPALLMSVGTAN